MSDNVKKKSWFAKHKVLTTIIVLVVLFGVISAASGGSDTGDKSNGSSNSKSSSNKEYRFADRADKQDKDVEVVAGEAATVDGVKLTVSSVEYKTSLGEFQDAPSGKTYVIADVVLENTSDRTKPYNSFNFRIQTVGGQVLDSTFVTVPTPLNSGDIVAGGKAQGQVAFEVPVEEGHQYILWKPGFGSERAVIQAK